MKCNNCGAHIAPCYRTCNGEACEHGTGFVHVNGSHYCGKWLSPLATPQIETVKTIDIFGQVHDTHQTEAELNGWKPTQARTL